MKLKILESVYTIINNDSSLKQSEKEWRYFFSNWLYRINGERYTKKDYITISSEYLKSIFGFNYKIILQYFIEKNLLSYYLSSNGGKSYSAGSECSRWIVSFDIDCEFIEVEFTSKTVLNKLIALLNGSFRKKYENDKYNINIKHIETIEAAYKEILNKVNSNIPNELLEKITEIREEALRVKELILPYNAYLRKPKHYYKYTLKLESLKQELLDLNQEKKKLEDLLEDNSYKRFSIDGYGLRVHTSFTSLNKKYRNEITLNNELLQEIDIVNCQPWLMSNLPGVNDKQFIADCINGDFYEKFYNESSLYNELKNKKRNALEEAEFLRVKEIRSQVKVDIYKIFFGSYQKCRPALYKDRENKNTVLYKFIEMYPSVWEFIEEYNADDFHNLSKDLQRMESDLIVFSTWYKLYTLGVDALTIHDALYVTEKDKDICIETLKYYVEQKNYTLPKFK